MESSWLKVWGWKVHGWKVLGLRSRIEAWGWKVWGWDLPQPDYGLRMVLGRKSFWHKYQYHILWVSFLFTIFKRYGRKQGTLLCRSAHSNQLHCQELDRLRIACHLENCTLTCPIPLEFLSPKIILSKAIFFFFSFHTTQR